MGPDFCSFEMEIVNKRHALQAFKTDELLVKTRAQNDMHMAPINGYLCSTSVPHFGTPPTPICR